MDPAARRTLTIPRRAALVAAPPVATRRGRWVGQCLARRRLVIDGDQEPNVEWHTVDGYRLSFDVREDASRFIVLRGSGTHAVVFGKGLIDRHAVLWDACTLGFGERHSIERELVHRWSAMVGRLRARRSGLT